MARMRVTRSGLLLAAGILLLSSPVAAATRPFLFSLVPAQGAHAGRALAYADLAYGRDLFEGVGQEALETNIGSQFALSPRALLVGHLGLSVPDELADSRVDLQVEALLSALPAQARGAFALGVGARREYDGSAVALGRVVAGYRWARTSAVTNLRLERPFANKAGSTRRDALDVLTTFGVTRQVNEAFSLGVEAVAEDLEGLFESDEAEGGAKLMVGPSVGLGHAAAPWHLLIAGGPVFRLTNSTATAASPALRELTTRTGYVVRTSLDYRW